jgi:hypothetical protein
VVGFGQVRSKRFEWVWLEWTDLGEEFPGGRGMKSESGWSGSEAGMSVQCCASRRDLDRPVWFSRRWLS